MGRFPFHINGRLRIVSVLFKKKELYTQKLLVIESDKKKEQGKERKKGVNEKKKIFIFVFHSI